MYTLDMLSITRIHTETAMLIKLATAEQERRKSVGIGFIVAVLIKVHTPHQDH